MSMRNFDLTSMSLRLSVRRKARRGVDLKTFAQRWEVERTLKCLRMMDYRERRAGLYAITKGTRLSGSVVVSLGLSARLSRCDGVSTLYLMFEEREIVSTVVEVLYKFVST